MATKTFVPAIYHLLHKGAAYVTKHHATLLAKLGPTNMGLLDNVVTAINTFLGAVTVPPEEP